MHKIALVIFFLITNIYAHPAKEALETLEKAQGYVQKMDTAVADPLCENCSTPELLNRCIQETCAKGKITQNYIELDAQQKANVLNNLNDPKIKVAYDQYRKSLQELADAEIDVFRREITYTNEVLRSGELSTDSDKIRWVTLFELMGLTSEENIRKLPVSLQVTRAGAFPAFQKHALMNLNFYVGSPQIHLNNKYKGMDLKRAVDIEFQKYEETRSNLLNTRFAKSLPTLANDLDNFYNSKIYKDYKAGKNISVDDLDPLFKAQALFETMTRFLNDPAVQNLHQTMDLQAIKDFALSEHVKPKVEQIAGQINTFKDSPEYSEYIDNCAVKFIATYANLPDKSVHKKLKEVGEDLKKQIKEKVLSQLSTETSRQLSKVVDNVSFQTIDKDDFLNKLKSNINFEQHRHNSIQTQKRPESEIKARASAYLRIMNYQDNGLDNRKYILSKALSDTNSICETGTMPLLSDMTYSSHGIISVSRASTMDWNAGRAIMAHELGHIIDKALTPSMSEASYLAKSYINKCLSENHTASGGVGYQYLGEDYSDMISAVLEGPNGNNVGCFLNNKDMVGHIGSSHPNGFFRMIHVERTMRGSIPATCERFIAASKSMDNPKSCWK